jgi:hypothetical protein
LGVFLAPDLQGLSARSSRKAAVSRRSVVVRAEEKAVAKVGILMSRREASTKHWDLVLTGRGASLQVDRSKDTLLFADSNSLKYLDGTLPGDYGQSVGV